MLLNILCKFRIIFPKKTFVQAHFFTEKKQQICAFRERPISGRLKGVLRLRPKRNAIEAQTEDDRGPNGMRLGLKRKTGEKHIKKKDTKKSSQTLVENACEDFHGR